MANSTNQELAHAFINYMYRPEVSVQNMNEIMYMAPHKEAVKLVNESLRNNSAFMVSEDVRAKCIPLLDLEQDNALYIKAWERIRAE